MFKYPEPEAFELGVMLIAITNAVQDAIKEKGGKVPEGVYIPNDIAVQVLKLHLLSTYGKEPDEERVKEMFVNPDEDAVRGAYFALGFFANDYLEPPMVDAILATWSELLKPQNEKLRLAIADVFYQQMEKMRENIVKA